MIAHAEATPSTILTLVIAVIESALGAGSMALLRSTSRIAPPLTAAGRAIDLTAVAAGAHREGLAATTATKLDPVVHAPRRAEILAPLPELRDGRPVHAPAGHESREVQLLALDLLSRLSQS